jgi:hypothetical protein
MDITKTAVVDCAIRQMVQVAPLDEAESSCDVPSAMGARRPQRWETRALVAKQSTARHTTANVLLWLVCSDRVSTVG